MAYLKFPSEFSHIKFILTLNYLRVVLFLFIDFVLLLRIGVSSVQRDLILKSLVHYKDILPLC